MEEAHPRIGLVAGTALPGALGREEMVHPWVQD